MGFIPYQRQETPLVKSIYDMNAIRAAEMRPIQPGDILSPPMITFKLYRCISCGCNSFKLVPMPVTSATYGRVINFRCIRCGSVCSSSSVKENIGKQIQPRGVSSR